MPKVLGDFLHDLLKKAGQNVEDAKVKDFLSNTAMTMEIPDEVAKGLDNNLLSVTDAKNNHPEIKAHYTKSALDGVDSVINDLLKDLPEEVKTDILGERSSYKRVPMLFEKIKELEAKKSSGKGDKDALQKQIDDLHKALADQKKTLSDTEQKHKDALLRYRVEAELKTMFSQYKTTFDELDPAVKSATIKSLLDKELQDKDADFTFDDKDNFTILKKDGSNYYGENHQQVAPQAFIESLLSRNKLLVTTPKAGDTKPTITQPTSGGGKSEATGTGTLKALLQESKQALNGAAAIV